MSRHDLHPPRRGRTMEPDLRIAWHTSVAGDSPGREAGLKSLVVSSSGAIAVITEQGAKIMQHGGGVRELVGQEGGISTAVASAKALIAGGTDGFIKWWHLESGEQIASTSAFPDAGEGGQAREVGLVASSSTHSPAHLVAAASGRLVSIFGSGGEHLHSLPTVAGNVTAMVWLSASQLAAASTDRAGGDAGPGSTCLQTWVVTQDTVSAGWSLDMGSQGPLASLALSPNGAFLAACSPQLVTVWDVEGKSAGDPPGSPVFQYQREDDQLEPCTCLTWDSSSQYLATAFGNQLLAWNIIVPGGPQVECTGHAPGTNITSIAFQSSGPLLGAAADDGSVFVFDTSHFNAPYAKHVASTRLSVACPCKGFVAWHVNDAIIAAYQSGEVACLEAIPDMLYDEVTPNNGGFFRGRNDYNSSRGGFDSTRGRGRGRVAGYPQRVEPQRGPMDQDFAAHSRVLQGPPRMAAGPTGSGFRGGRAPQPVRVSMPPAPPGQVGRPPLKAKPDGPALPEGATGGWWPGESAPNMSWPQMQPMPYMMFAPTQAVQGPMPGFTQPAPPPGSFKPVAGMPSSSNISTSVWAPGAMSMPPTAQMPVYMYPGQWPMTYMQQWPGYYPYFGFQPGPMTSVISMPQTVSGKAGAPSEVSVGGASSSGIPRPATSEGAATSEGGGWPGMGGRPRPSSSKQRQPSMRQSSGELPPGLMSPGQPGMGGFMPIRADSDSLDVGESQAAAISSGGSSSYSAMAPAHGHMQAMAHPHGMHQVQMSQGGQALHQAYPQAYPQPHGMQPFPNAQQVRPGAMPLRMRGAHPGDGGSGFDEGSLNVYVGNLAPAVDEMALHSSFSQFGYISSTQVIRDKETGDSRGFGFVTFGHPMSAWAAMQHMNGVTLGGPFGGQSIKVSPSRKNT